MSHDSLSNILKHAAGQGSANHVDVSPEARDLMVLELASAYDADPFSVMPISNGFEFAREMYEKFSDDELVTQYKRLKHENQMSSVTPVKDFDII